MNGLRVVGKKIGEVKLAVSGAGAAALSCLDMLVALGVRLENIWVSDIEGVVYEGRKALMDENKARYAKKTDARTLGDIIGDADIFLGLSAGGVLKPEMVKKMAANPLVFALANPVPEILPAEVKAVRDDAVIATGRSDYPNQVNNVLCFPFIFRGALDVGATTINEPMKLAAVNAIADLAMAEHSDIVAMAYQEEQASFGRDYLIPKPFDPRLIVKIAPAVAMAAMESGVATSPIRDFEAYVQGLNEFVYHSGHMMRPVFAAAKSHPKAIVYAEGEDERILRAVQVIVDEKLARPILIGRPAVLEKRILKFGLRLKAGEHFDVVNPEWDPRYREYWTEYHQLTERRGVSLSYAKIEMRRRNTLIGSMLIHKGAADGMICGTFGTHQLHLHYVDQVIGLRPGVKNYYAMNILMLSRRTVFICDTYVNDDPTPEQLAEMTQLAAEEILRFGTRSARGPPFALELRHQQFALGDEDAHGAGAHPRADARTRGRRRNARRRGDLRRGAKGRLPELAAQGRGEPPHHADGGRGQHLLQPAQDRLRRRRHRRADPARGAQAGAHPHAHGDGPAYHQHDGGGRRRRAGATRLAVSIP